MLRPRGRWGTWLMGLGWGGSGWDAGKGGQQQFGREGIDVAYVHVFAVFVAIDVVLKWDRLNSALVNSILVQKRFSKPRRQSSPPIS